MPRRPYRQRFRISSARLTCQVGDAVVKVFFNCPFVRDPHIFAVTKCRPRETSLLISSTIASQHPSTEPTPMTPSNRTYHQLQHRPITAAFRGWCIASTTTCLAVPTGPSKKPRRLPSPRQSEQSPFLTPLFEAQTRIGINRPLPDRCIQENFKRHTNEKLSTHDIEALRSPSRTSRQTKSPHILCVQLNCAKFASVIFVTPARAQEAGRFLQRRKPDVFNTGQHMK